MEGKLRMSMYTLCYRGPATTSREHHKLLLLLLYEDRGHQNSLFRYLNRIGGGWIMIQGVAWLNEGYPQGQAVSMSGYEVTSGLE